MNHHSTPSPFFVLEDVIEATRFAMRESHRLALEYRRSGRIEDYRRKMRDACWYRKRLADTWRETPELETIDG